MTAFEDWLTFGGQNGVNFKVRDFIHETTFSRVKFCVETESDIKNAQLLTWKFFP